MFKHDIFFVDAANLLFKAEPRTHFDLENVEVIKNSYVLFIEIFAEYFESLKTRSVFF